jgi:hypothetical protein
MLSSTLKLQVAALSTSIFQKIVSEQLGKPNQILQETSKFGSFGSENLVA